MWSSIVQSLQMRCSHVLQYKLNSWLGWRSHFITEAIMLWWRLRHSNKHNTTQHNTTQHNTTHTTQHNTTQHNTTQHNTTQHNTTIHNNTQQYTTQHNTTQHNTTQHKTYLLLFIIQRDLFVHCESNIVLMSMIALNTQITTTLIMCNSFYSHNHHKNSALPCTLITSSISMAIKLLGKLAICSCFSSWLARHLGHENWSVVIYVVFMLWSNQCIMCDI
jgi:hypothetical protein